MTGLALSPSDIFIPALLPHQQTVKLHPARFKVWRGGRRIGKTRGAFNCSVIGHGPRRPDGRRKWSGIVHGYDVIWLVPDYPQGQTIWAEEIEPRFIGVPGVQINQQDRTVTLPDAGTLEVRSDKNVDGIRGKGKRLGGIFIDEAQKIDLAYAWKRVIRPVLLDNGGWCIMGGTPHLGSYFNTICEEIEAGKRAAKWWATFHHRTRDYAPFPKADIDDLYAEYPPGSSEAAEELDAELLRERGEVYRREWFHRYQRADARGMMAALVEGAEPEMVPFVEVRLYVDLAASVKQSADYTVIRAVGLSPVINKRRYAGVLENVRARMEGPAQLAEIERMAETWRPSKVKVESVAYQLTAVQHLRQRGKVHVEELRPDKDKRARSIPGAAAMARREIFWPSDGAAPWMAGLVEEHIRFTGDAKKDQHDDDVDVTGYLGLDLAAGNRPMVY